MQLSPSCRPVGHAFHIHEKGQCDAATSFESAGGHFAPLKHTHGYLSADGPHAGDMPNQFVGSDGALQLQVVNPNVTLGSGEGALFDADGSALVLHAKLDDYRSQPSGDAGDRIACAVIQRK
jgi:Cu-Zn family superoxide dismutase